MDGSRGVAAAAVLGLCVAGGLAAGGWLMGQGVARVRAAERHVTVKGFAEREVPADLALWPIVYSATGNDLVALHAQLDRDAELVRQFLLGRGFGAEEITRSAPRVTDSAVQGNYGAHPPPERYTAESTVTLRTGDVEAVKSAMAAAASLVKEGVAVTSSYEYRPQFLFTRLDAIKPAMIAEATVDARHAAEQFAKDSGSAVGAIRSAQQGYFTIEDRDPYSPEFKKVRVVTTVEYFLVD
jgi:hypothetical protein